MIKRIRALIRKEYRQIRRDIRTLGVLLFLPMFLLMMFGYALDFDVKNIRTAVLDQDLSRESRRLVQLIGAYDYFEVVRIVESPAQIDALIDQEKIQAALIIPPDFSRILKRGEEAEIQFIVDGVNGNIGQTGSAYITQIVQAFAAQEQVKVAAKLGFEFKPVVQTEERIWFNPELKSTNFLVPGLIAFILMITSVISTALSVVREKEHNTIEQIIVSPVRSFELMIGKSVPFMVIAFSSACMILLVGWFLFGVVVKGSYPTLLVSSIIFLFGALGQGLLISTVANTQAVAFMMAILSSLLPTMLLSGFIFRLDSMPLALQAFSYLVPARYFLVILRGVILKGTSFEYYGEQFLFLIAFAMLMLMISSKKMSMKWMT